MRTPRATPQPTVVLLHPVRQAMGDARRRAEAMAVVLGAQLLVVKLARPSSARTHMLFPQAQHAEGLAVLQEGLREMRVLERWQAWRERKGAAPVEALGCAASVAEVLLLCAEREVVLVVMPAAFSWFGAGVTSLVARSGVPVLLAHRARAHDRLVVATNLRDPARPLIKRAFELTERLGASLTVVHNAPHFAAQAAAAGLGPTPSASEDDGGLANELRLELASLGSHPAVTVTHRLDTARGILETATRQDADLIVVGVRARAPSRMFAGGVAERVCSSAGRSVLLVPV